MIYGHPDRPAVCNGLKPSPEMCGRDAADAMAILSHMEALTAPSQ